MKRIISVLLLALSITVPTVNAVDAYRYHGTQQLVVEDSVDTFSEETSLRHLCSS